MTTPRTPSGPNRLHLDDLFHIPDAVHAGQWVQVLGRAEAETQELLRTYVVTDQLADCFDEALSLIKSGLQTNASQAAYLDGSFGAGKSHFLGVLRAILDGVPEARGKEGLENTVAKHDEWLRGKKFLRVNYHMTGSVTLETAVLGGYVDIVRELHPDAPLPAVYRDQELLKDAAHLRRRLGDEAFIADLPLDDEDEDASAGSVHQGWGSDPNWDTDTLDAAFAAPPGDPERARLVSDLMAPGSHFASYHDAVRATKEGFIDLDKGLSVISHHAKEVLGYDAIVLLLDEMILWLQQYVGDTPRLRGEAQKVSKLVESAEASRPAPIISFVPRQRDISELVGRGVSGADHEALFDTLKYWDGRFSVIKFADTNLPTIVQRRLLQVKSPEARTALDQAFARTGNTRQEIWDTLLDAQGEASDRDAFRRSYPFSPAFLHIMVDVSSALQRNRSALKLMSEMLIAYRDRLELGQLMPVGAIFQVLLEGNEAPVSAKLKAEFDKTKSFYLNRLRPYLLAKHKLTEETVKTLSSRHPFLADDLIGKTLMLAAMVPSPALQDVTATRLVGLNLGAVATMIPGQERGFVAQTLRGLASQFGEFSVTGTDDPRVDVNLIGVNTQDIIRRARGSNDDAAARRRTLKKLLWRHFGLSDLNAEAARRMFTWRGTEREVEVLFTNIREAVEATFTPMNDHAVRLLVDYPFDEGNFNPSDDRRRVTNARGTLTGTPPLTLAWLPSFFTPDRLGDLGDLVVINYLLERPDRLEQHTAHLTSEERIHARGQLRSRQSGLTDSIEAVLRQAYGTAAPVEVDVEPHGKEHLMALDSRAAIDNPPPGMTLADAFEWMCRKLLDHAYPGHPDLDPERRGRTVKKTELAVVLDSVDKAAQLPNRRLEASRTDLAILKRIADPLEIGTVGEVFVLRDEWLLRLDRRAAGTQAEDVSVGQVRRWIEEEMPGLPDQITDLVVCVYAILADRTWLRAERPIPPPSIGALAPEMVLRKQELPTREEFALSSVRATEIFGAEARATYTSRSANALARQAREQARESMSDVRNLRTGLDLHAETLGLAEGGARMETAEALSRVIDELLPHTDATPTLRVLAEAELPKATAVYQRCLTSAKALSEALATASWPILEALVATAKGTGGRAESAALLLADLHSAASHDELELALAPVLTRVTHAAARLLARSEPTPPQPPRPIWDPDVIADPAPKKPDTERVPAPPKVREVTVRSADAVLKELADEMAADPKARFEISWRRVN